MRRVLTILGAFVFAVQVVIWLPRQVQSTTPSDADVYRRAAERFAAGQPIYGGWPRERLDHPPGAFLYPPTALLLCEPFAGSGRAAFRWGCYALIVAAFWALAAALARIVLEKATLTNTLMTGTVLQFMPGIASIMWLGNADLVVWALVAWAFAAPRLAGALLTCGAALKVYPAVLIMAFGVRASRRFHKQAAFLGVGILGLALIVLGGGVFTEWRRVGLPALSEGVFPTGNFSLSTALVRIFVRDMTSPLPRAAHLFLSWFPWVTVAAVAWTQRQRSIAKYGALVLVAAVWAAPICWWWRLTSALIVAGAVWIRERRHLPCESL
jgi:hypothetical protein